VRQFSALLAELGWVSDVLVGGSLATGDHVSGVSDLDLVAVVEGSVDPAREAVLVRLHRDLDHGSPAGTDLGCVYVEATRLSDSRIRHPTWTHGQLVHRGLSDISRAELVRHGFAVYGRPPASLLPPMTDDQVRSAARSELCGYWAWASRRPWMWLDPMIADLGRTSMARARHTVQSGHLLPKTQSIEQAHAPDWLIDQLRTRRRGGHVGSPRLRTAWIAWRDARGTIKKACRA
jgi:Nucleotidyltransferase domain